MQVPPDFYIPDFDEDEQNPDERVDRKWKILKSQRAHLFVSLFIGTWFGYFLLHQLEKILFSSNQTFMKMPTAEHTRDKQIQRDDEYYDGDNDNDQNMDDWCVDCKIYLCII